MIAKPALENWKINNAGVYALSHLTLLAKVEAEDHEGALALIKNGSKKDSTKAADRGTEVHAMCEKIMRAKLAGRKASFPATPEDMKFLRNFARWVKEFDVRPVACELAVWNQELGYAGRLDLLAWCKIDGEWVLCIVDYKTGASGIWPDAAVQQVAYINATHHIDPVSDELVEGWPVTAPPETAPQKRLQWEPQNAFALWLRPDGKAFIPLDTSESTWDEFKRRRDMYYWNLKDSKKVVGKAINENPLTRKWKGLG